MTNIIATVWAIKSDGSEIELTSVIDAHNKLKNREITEFHIYLNNVERIRFKLLSSGEFQIGISSKVGEMGNSVN